MQTTHPQFVKMGCADGKGFDIPREALAKLHRLRK
jgi:hypothetical protein